MVERIFRRHCPGLFLRNPVQSCIEGDTAFAMFGSKVRNQLGG